MVIEAVIRVSISFSQSVKPAAQLRVRQAQLAKRHTSLLTTGCKGTSLSHYCCTIDLAVPGAVGLCWLVSTWSHMRSDTEHGTFHLITSSGVSYDDLFCWSSACTESTTGTAPANAASTHHRRRHIVSPPFRSFQCASAAASFFRNSLIASLYIVSSPATIQFVHFMFT